MTSPDKAWMIRPTNRPDMAQVGFHGKSRSDRDRLGIFWEQRFQDILPEDVLPLLVRQSSGALPPFSLHTCESYGNKMIDARFREVIMALDPEACWLADIVFTDVDGTEIRDAYWLLRVLPKIDAIVTEKSRGKWLTETVQLADGSKKVRELGMWQPKGVESAGSTVLSRSAVEGHHIWRVEGWVGVETFVSDVFLNALLDAGCEPFHRIPVTLI